MAIADKYGIPVIEDAAEGFGSKFNGQVLGTFGKYGVLSFNGNKMITTSGGGALITPDEESWREIMMYATQYRESYPYYQHERIGEVDVGCFDMVENNEMEERYLKERSGRAADIGNA